MKKLLKWHDAYTLKILVCFLILFTALYPKLPSVHIVRTWVYIRLEDFLIFGTTLIWFIQLLRKKVTFPLWIGGAIAGYWLVGLASLIYSLLFIAPHLLNFFPHIAALNYGRRLEYMILFFVGFSTVRSIKDIRDYAIIMSVTLLGILIYGFGQKYYLLLWSAYPAFFEKYSFCFPSFQTGNEEFAKGIPLCLPNDARITSTFGGHYDLAAYLVLVLPVFAGLFLSVRQWFWKVSSAFLFVGGLAMLILTASRVSFGAYLVGSILTLILFKKKWFIIPVVLISILMLLTFSDSTAKRFLATVRMSSIVTDNEGQIVGESTSSLSDDLKKKLSKDSTALQKQSFQSLPKGSAFIGLGQKKRSTSSAIVQKTLTPEESRRLQLANGSLQLSTVSGNFTVRQVLVYDISFTTRFQSEWPNALKAFMRNPLLGSGYSSITLATDNDYLRALGETGLLGLFAFIFIFIVMGITVSSLTPHIESRLVKGFVFGLAGGVVGLACNAVLIDVFEASKVAENLWLLLGIGVGGLFAATHQKVPYWPLVRKVLSSNFFLAFYLFVILAFVFFPNIANFFVADDFTWLYWAASASGSDIAGYFTNSQNFFYRPLDKTIVVLLYNIFAFQPGGYHMFTLLLHFLSVVAVSLISNKLFKNKVLAFATAFLFLLQPVHAENIYWFSTISVTLATMFMLYAVNALLKFRYVKNRFVSAAFYLLAFVFSILSFVSYEAAVVIPFLLLAIDFMIVNPKKKLHMIWVHAPFFALLPAYAVVRQVTHTFNGGGDYIYSMQHLIPNIIGNFFGYTGLFLSGHSFLPVYEALRNHLRSEVVVSVSVAIVALIALGLVLYYYRKNVCSYLKSELGRVFFFGVIFVLISLAPFLALGNIAERYLYLASFGFVLALVAALQSFLSAFVSAGKKRYLLLGAFVLLVGIFYYQEDMQQSQKWTKAGNITQDTLALFRTDYPAFAPTASLYFVNPPQKYDGVWVFPSGLKNGLWFIYGDELPDIYQGKSVSEVRTYIKMSGTTPNYIFTFDTNGKIHRVK